MQERQRQEVGKAWEAHLDHRCSCGLLGRAFIWVQAILHGNSEEGPGCIAYTPEALAASKKINGR